MHYVSRNDGSTLGRGGEANRLGPEWLVPDAAETDLSARGRYRNVEDADER
jgi:hypothetical protein